MPNRKALGDQAEAVAGRYLQSKGVRILERNVYNRGGEIDLIGQDEETLVFFEVRFRKQGGLTDGAESIGWRKQQKLLRAVSFYLHRHGLWDHPCRIDVVAIAPGTTHQYRIRWIRNAIQADL
ncbi:YraN family protein [Marinobacter bryozoorum]|jgi:putative endonuclease|uniref:YraN family protein n=1 Tax=Marinobacter bryozoorum TaxID=256324 RepID=UPI002005E0EC|nr:YraN family protein [Marinobacter bryozoorum]MCK7543858.1 YraN family protein [Marinobacter bryozoorum]